jgi:hypothetical protein
LHFSALLSLSRQTLALCSGQ